MASNDDYILQVIRDVGLATDEQIEQAKAAYSPSSKEGEPASLALAVASNNPSAYSGVVDALIKLGYVREQDVSLALASQFGMDTINLAEVRIPDEVLRLIPPNMVRRYRAIPVAQEGNLITIAISDPMDISTVDSLRLALRANVDPVIATRSDIDQAIARYYGTTEETVEKALEELTEENIQIGDIPGTSFDDAGAELEDAEAPIIKLVNLIILQAFQSRASDIHLEPMEKRFRVRYRIDGVMTEVDSPPKRLQAAIIGRLKIMSKMNLAERRIPQDGRIQVSVREKTLDLRVSVIPTGHGESVVMRILDKSGLTLGLPQLGFFSDDQATFEKLITLPDGILLVTGPTGSGKTTTLYSCLNFINRPDRKIITAEDPVEYMLAGINQVQINNEIGMSFSLALRSMLRQAPNIVMVGEIRDKETAEIAIQAALTGHLVFSTLHTNDAPSAVTRLQDIGVKPFLVASATRGIMAQRLVRKICQRCKEPYTPTEEELHTLGVDPGNLSDTNFQKGAGCPECNKKGYRGRFGIFEVFVVNDEIRTMIFQGVTSDDLAKRAREMGMRTLREDGVRKVLAGLTTTEEVVAATQADH